MFSKGKSAEASAPPPPKQTRSGRSAPSIISADVVLIGNITSGGDLQIDGTIEGDIRSTSLTVGDKATINGEVFAEDVVVRGRVMGSIRARRVQLCSTCHVEGNILHEALAVESGAYFEGNCRHSADPLGDDGKRSFTSEPKKSNGNGAGSRTGGGIFGNYGGTPEEDEGELATEGAEDDKV